MISKADIFIFSPSLVFSLVIWSKSWDDVCPLQLPFLHFDSQFVFFIPPQILSFTTKVDTCFSWSAVPNTRHILSLGEICLPWPNQWNELRKRHIHITDWDHTALLISLKLLSTMSCFAPQCCSRLNVHTETNTIGNWIDHKCCFWNTNTPVFSPCSELIGYLPSI